MRNKFSKISALLFLCVILETGCGAKADDSKYQQQFENAGQQKETTEQKEDTLPQEESSFALVNLKTNWIDNPVGVDISTPCFSWELQSEEKGTVQKAYRIKLWQTGADEKVLLWDTGTVFSSQTTQIPYEGEALQSHSAYEWEVAGWNQEDQMSEMAFASFRTSYIEEQPFQDAHMISMQGEENVYDGGQAVFIKDFDVYGNSEKKLRQATIYASALGIYDAYINGQRVGEDELKPGWSNYEKSLYYNTYDITELLVTSAKGEPATPEVAKNRIAVMLGTGWWCGRVGFGTYDYHKPTFVCTIRLEYEDGQVQEVHTDESWRYVKDTSVVWADIFNGEVYDARKPGAKALSMSGDDQGFPEKKQVVINTDFNGVYHSFYGNPVRHMPEYDREPVRVVVYDSVSENGTTYGEISVKRDVPYSGDIHLLEGETAIFDLGQNMTGVPFVSYEAEAGTEVMVDFAEMLNDSGQEDRGNDGPKGSLYTANYRSAQSDLKLISNGDGVQEYQPVYTYYGFRYLSVTATKDMILHEIQGRCIGNSSPEIGFLHTDLEVLNQLFENVKWTQRNNFLLVATDCPQRDERLGWMGDLQVFARTSLYNQDLISFYQKWIRDCMESQTEEGAYTDTVPRTVITGSGNAGWGDAGISVPYDVYCMYADVKLLESSYDSMCRYMEYLSSISNFDVTGGRVGPLTTYGDWLGFEDSDKELVSTLYYAKDAMQMAEIAGILEDKKGEREYRELFDRIKEYFQQKYMSDGHVAEAYRTQTVLILTMEYGLLSQQQEQSACEDLLEKLEGSEGKLTTGFLGTPLILKTLSEHGFLKEAYELLLQTENPSWLYSIAQGATTIWERYDSYTLENGFQDAAMNSFDHFNNGSVAAWMYEDMLGIRIRQDDDGNECILLKPGIIPDAGEALVHQAEGSVHSVYGTVSVSWQITDEEISYVVTVPANCRASLWLPIYDKQGNQAYQTENIGSGTHVCHYDKQANEWRFSASLN